MQKSQVRSFTVLLSFVCITTACSKKGQTGSTASSSLSFQTTTTTSPVTAASIHFPVNVVAVQQVDTLNTTLISGSYGDTSAKAGSISIRVIGDTTSTYNGGKVFVTYVDGSGDTFTSAGDSADVVTITHFPKADEAIVSGSFHVTVTGTTGSLMITGGSFSAPFLD